MMLSEVCLSVAYIRPKSRTERPKKTKIGTEVAYVTRDSDTTFKVKGQGHQAALVGCTGRPTWTHSNGHLSICVHDVLYIVSILAGLGWAYRGGRPPTACSFNDRFLCQSRRQLNRIYRPRMENLYILYFTFITDNFISVIIILIILFF